MISIAIASDLHFEFYKGDPAWLPPLPSRCDVLILAGDIGVGDGALEAVLKIADALPNTQIVWVAGNHEFYRQSIDTRLAYYRKECAPLDRVHFLENDRVEILGYTFLGCTLWTGFDCLGQEKKPIAAQEAQYSISDFTLIRTSNGKKPFSAIEALHKYTESRQWLDSQLALADPDKTVVVTHFPPSRSLRHGAIPEDLLSAYFQANCGDLIDAHQPVLWAYGHNHWSDEIKIGKTRIVSHQLGYPNEGDLPAFHPNKLFILEENERR